MQIDFRYQLFIQSKWFVLCQAQPKRDFGAMNQYHRPEEERYLALLLDFVTYGM